jgi:Transposase IS116/IS110/IS902 family
VPSVAHLARSTLVWTSTRTPSRSGSWTLTSRSPTSSGSPTTSRRSAGSSPSSMIHGCCEPATRPARPASSWPGCCTAWTCAAGWSPVADPPGARRQGPRPTGGTAAGSPRLHRAGELVAVVRVPTLQEEAVRDLCRTRADLVEDLTRARNRLGKFLLRHGRSWRGGSTGPTPTGRGCGPNGSTARHHPDVRPLPGRGRGPQPGAGRRGGRPGRLVRAAAVRLAGRSARRLPRVTRLGALALAAEVGRWRRFASATAFMGFCGLVPREYSSGNRVHRGRRTKAGNAHLRAQLAWVGLVLPAPPPGRRGDRPPPARP